MELLLILMECSVAYVVTAVMNDSAKLFNNCVVYFKILSS